MSRPRHAFPITGDRLSGRLITPENRNWWTLAVPLGLFMIMLDATVVSVALPAIRNSLHMLIPQGEPPLEWAERRYNIRTWTVTPKGGHFAPAEEPELVAGTSRRSSPPCTDH